MITKMKQDARNTLLKAQEEIVVFLTGVGGYLPEDFDGKISWPDHSSITSNGPVCGTL